MSRTYVAVTEKWTELSGHIQKCELWVSSVHLSSGSVLSR